MKKYLFCMLVSGVILLGRHGFARAEVGKLKINCIPEAYIFIDGQAAYLGTIKKIEINVDVGKHLVTAEATGYLQEAAKVEVYPGSVTKLNLSLVEADQDRSQMASIPPGEYEIGLTQKRIKWVTKNIGGKANDYKTAVPKHTLKLKAYRIDKYEVTNSRYKKFIRATKHLVPRHWRGDTYRKNRDDYPVINVSWQDAAAYCKWAGKRLPSEAEWEVAANGDSGFLFPWGRKFREAWTNTAKERFRAPTITGRYKKGTSKFGCYDLAGNVAEWTADVYKPYPGADSGSTEVDQNLRVVRGGSYKDKPFMATTVYRKKLPADVGYKDVGFRCAR